MTCDKLWAWHARARDVKKFGEMAEWLKAAASKAVVPVFPVPGVRIPLSPPAYATKGLDFEPLCTTFVQHYQDEQKSGYLFLLLSQRFQLLHRHSVGRL